MNDPTAAAIIELARVINPFSQPYSMSDGGTIGCVVEGQIATAKGLLAIASAIEDLAEAVREGNQTETN